MPEEPFVSVLTPVYNGEPFLAECIESVLAQGYTNWEYIIVNNCSTDGSLALAERYARLDPRIRLVSNQVFVNCEENHNNAFRQIAPRSRYTKVVSADDRLLPHCLETMIRFATQNPTVGIVSSYQQRGQRIRWKGIPEEVSVLSGREACRLHLLQGLYVFGNPTSVLYRSDLVRKENSFFPHDEPHADTSAFHAHLRDCDFGFIHEVLSVSREHEGQVSAGLQDLLAEDLAYLDLLKQYGRYYLTEAELAARWKGKLDDYYRMLGRSLLTLKGRDFWGFQEQGLGRIGFAVDWKRVFFESMRKLALGGPVAALRKFKLAGK